MAIGSSRGSTVDNTNGIPFATITYEGSASPAPEIQALAVVGNKSTYAEVSRTGLTTSDVGTTDMSGSGFGTSLVDMENCISAFVRATCNTAGKNMTGVLILYDGSANCIGMSETMSFLSDALKRVTAAGDFICMRQVADTGRARKCKFFITSMDASATWAVYVGPM